MKKKLSVKFNVLQKFILSHLAIELVVLAALIPVYNLALTAARNQQIHESYARLQTSVSQISGEFESATTLMTLLSRDTDVQSTALYRSSLTPSEYYRASSSKRLLLLSTLDWDLLSDCYVFFARNEIVLSAERAWFTYDSFYGEWLRYEDVDVEEWSQSLKNSISSASKSASGVQTAYSYDSKTSTFNTREVITCRLPFVNQSNSAMAVFLISTKTLLKTLGVSDDGYLLVYDANGSALYSYNAPESAEPRSSSIAKAVYGGAAYTVFTMKDSASGFTYVVGRPTAAIGSAVTQPYRMLVVYVVVAALLGSLLSAVFAYRQYSPVKRLNAAVHALSSNSSKGYRDEYEYFIGTFMDMREHNQEFIREIESYNEAMRTRALEDLLLGRYAAEGDLQRLSGYVTLPTEYRLGIAKLQVDYENESPNMTQVGSSILNVSLMNTLGRAWREAVLLHPLSEDQLVFIVPENMTREKLQGVMQSITREITAFSDVRNAHVFFAVSGVNSSAEELGTAFDDAKNILAFRYNCENPIVFLEDIAGTAQIPVLSGDSTEKLREYILQGDEGKASELIHAVIYNRYLRDGDYSQLFYSIRGVLVSVLSAIKTENGMDIPYYAAEKEREEQTAALLESCRELCAYYKSRKKSHNDELKNRIIKYLQENHTNPDIYGKSVASQFNINEKYLYTFFKEQSGTSFATYLEALRLDHAVILLTSSKFCVNEISGMVGFNSPNTFYKAFLRVYGMPPSEYRTAVDRGQFYERVLNGIRGTGHSAGRVDLDTGATATHE